MDGRLDRVGFPRILPTSAPPGRLKKWRARIGILPVRTRAESAPGLAGQVSRSESSRACPLSSAWLPHAVAGPSGSSEAVVLQSLCQPCSTPTFGAWFDHVTRLFLAHNRLSYNRFRLATGQENSGDDRRRPRAGRPSWMHHRVSDIARGARFWPQRVRSARYQDFRLQPTMTTRRVLITDYAWPDLTVEQAVLSRAAAEVVAAPDASEATLARWAAEADAILTCWARVTAPVILAAPRLQVVARLGIGLDNIAVDTATRRGIPVTYVPDYCVEDVADHALALLLACARNVAFFHHRTKAGEYALKAARPMRRLRGQVLGLVGLGRIARALAAKARGIGLEVIACSASGNDYGTGVEMVGLEALLTRSDYVSLHLPLNASTARLIDTQALASMKPTAFLINTSRGGLVDHESLAAALGDDRIAGAALDVFDPEPPDLNQPLFLDERVIVTPHAAFLSVESLEELRTRAARQVADVLEGRRPENVVNPEVYEK